MSAPPINGSHPAVTVGGDVRMCVRASEVAPPAPFLGGDAQETARPARDITPEPVERHAHRPTRFRNFASRHVGEVREAATTSWPLTERPPAFVDVARATFPAKGEAGNPAVWVALAIGGVIRTVATGAGQMWLLAFATPIRATVSATVLVLLIAAHYVAGVINP